MAILWAPKEASESLSPGFIAQYGPAWVLTPEEWEKYRAINPDPFSSIGESSLPANRYEATYDQLAAAFNLAHPNQTLDNYIALHFANGVIPPEVIAQWGIPDRKAIAAAEELSAAYEYIRGQYVPEVDISKFDPAWVLENYRLTQQQEKQKKPTVPQGPPTPGFLAGELTGLKLGQPLEARPLKYASGQLLKKLTPSQIQGVGGYANWSAGKVVGAPASFEDWYYKEWGRPRFQASGTTSWNPSPQI